MSGGTWPPPDPAGGPLPMVDLEESTPTPPARRRKSPGVVIAATVGGLAVAAAAVFGIGRVLSGGDAGGAATPEQAGLDLLTAIENEDVLGAIDVLLPGERETLREPVTDLIDELSRLEVLSSTADPSSVAGVDVVFEDERVEVAETNVDDITNLEIFATASATVDGEELPIGDLVLDNIEGEPSDLDTEAPPEASDSPLQLTAVEEGGRWYLSLFHTLAESLRLQQTEPPDIPEEGVAPAGGDGPEDAVDAFLRGVEDLDVAAIIAALNPDEFQALQRYAPVFLESAQDSLDESIEESGVSVDIADPEYTVSGSGDTRSLSIDYARVDLSADGESVSVELEDGCWTVVAPEDELNSCELGDDMPTLEEMFGDAEPIQDLLTTFEEVFDGYEDPGFIVERVDGQWYLSPFGTLSEQLLAVMRALDRDEIEQVIDEVGDAFDAGLGDVVVGGITIEEEGEATASTIPPDDTQAPDDSTPTTGD